MKASLCNLIQDHEKEGMKCKDGTVSKSILYSNFNYKARPLNVERSLCCDRLGPKRGCQRILVRNNKKETHKFRGKSTSKPLLIARW